MYIPYMFSVMKGHEVPDLRNKELASTDGIVKIIDYNII